MPPKVQQPAAGTCLDSQFYIHADCRGLSSEVNAGLKHQM